MKSKIKTLLIILILFSPIAIIAQKKIIFNTKNSHYSLIPTKGYDFIFKHSINEISIIPDKKNPDAFCVIRLNAEKCFPEYVPGMPELPVMKQIIEIPEYDEIEISILQYKEHIEKIEDGKTINPFQPAPPVGYTGEIKYFKNEKYYSGKNFIHEGKPIVKVIPIGQMRGVRLARLELHLTDYNPATNELKIFYNIEVAISFKNANLVATENTKLRYHSRDFEPLFHASVINYKSIKENKNKNLVPLKYVIVADTMFAQTIKPFIQWKIQQGYNVHVAYTSNPAVGASTSSIKNYLQNLYLSGTTNNPAPTYILLVGDFPQIPSWPCIQFSTSIWWYYQTNKHSDFYFTDYTNDMLPEAFIGRLSANNIFELQPQIDKIIGYEKNLLNTEYLSQSLLISGDDYTNPPQLYENITKINGVINYLSSQYFNKTNGNSNMTYLYPETHYTSINPEIQNQICKGKGCIYYFGHAGKYSGWGQPEFQGGWVDSMFNTNKYAIMFGHCCYSIDIVGNYECFGERLLRAKNKGAVAYIAPSNVLWWDESYWWAIGSTQANVFFENPTYQQTGLGSFDRLFHTHGEPQNTWINTLGQLIAAGCMSIQETGSVNTAYYWEIMAMMGEPSMIPYFKPLQNITPKYPKVIDLNSNYIQISAAPFSQISITKDSNIIAFGIADSIGNCNLDFNPVTQTTEFIVTSTCKDIQTSQNKLIVCDLNKPYIAIDSFYLKTNNDSNLTYIQPKMEFSMQLFLKNYSKATATTCKIKVIDLDSNLILHDSIVNIISLPGLSSKYLSDAFRIKIFLPEDGISYKTIHLQYEVDGNTYQNELTIKLIKPSIQIESISFTDFFGGDGDMIFEKSELICGKINLSVNDDDLYNASFSINFDNPKIIATSLIKKFDYLKKDTNFNTYFYFAIPPDVKNGDIINIQICFKNAQNLIKRFFYFIVGSGLNFDTCTSLKFNMIGWNNIGEKWCIDKNTMNNTKCLKSGAINFNRQSQLFNNSKITVYEPDTLGFYFRVNSPLNKSYLQFRIDNTLIQQWSGNIGWTKFECPISPGSYTFRWRYIKNDSLPLDSSCAWIDDIILPNKPKFQDLEILQSGAFPSVICQGDSSLLHSYALGKKDLMDYSWQPNSFISTNNSFAVIAYPSSSINYTEFIADGFSNLQTSIKLDVKPKPTTPVITNNDGFLTINTSDKVLWYANGLFLPKQTSDTLFMSFEGDYYAKTINEHGCISNSSNIVTFNSFKQKPGSADKILEIWPVPAIDKFYIRYEIKEKADIRFVFYDYFGYLIKEIFYFPSQESGIYTFPYFIRELKQGLYYCTMMVNNKIVDTKKVIILKP